jgi:hypothetical protein
VGKEADHQAVAVADALDALVGLVGDLGDGVAGEVGQLAPLALEVGPQELDWVELGCLGRQPLHGQPGALGVQVGAHLVAPVRAQPSHSNTTLWPA